MIKLSEYGLKNGQALQSARLVEILADVKTRGARELIWDIDGIILDADNAVKRVLFIANTASEKEIPNGDRLVAFPIEGISGLTIDGQGNTVYYNGRMVQMAILNCHDITIKNFNFDYINPTVAEFLVVNKGLGYIDIIPNIDSGYTLEGGAFKFNCDNGGTMVIQECNPVTEITKRLCYVTNQTSFYHGSKGCKVNEDGSIRIGIMSLISYNVGCTYQLASVIRDGAGVFMSNSSDISLLSNNYKFMHGMGVLSQLVRNINIDNCNFTPNRDRGRTTATFADVIHCCNCKGRVSVTNCMADGTRDDVINVHGIHFKITDIKENRVKCVFSHAQTYGFNCFEAGDKIAFVGKHSLREKGRAIVKRVEVISPRETVLVLDTKVPARRGDVIENITWTAEVYVDNLKTSNIPTRGILVSTRKKVVIQNSTFYKDYMSSIHISDDAKSWFESGMVRDVTIRNNKFVECCDYPISIRPECFGMRAVHSGIAIENNEFVLLNNKLAIIRNADGVVMAFNKIVGSDKPIIKKRFVKNMLVK